MTKEIFENSPLDAEEQWIEDHFDEFAPSENQDERRNATLPRKGADVRLVPQRFVFIERIFNHLFCQCLCVFYIIFSKNKLTASHTRSENQQERCSCWPQATTQHCLVTDTTPFAFPFHYLQTK